ncbi:MAG: methionine adenosyltransferase [Candidatus Bathyarchaeia archaeon]
MRSIAVYELRQTPLEERAMEIVERKGLGHPDTICDSIMNEVSNRISEMYLKRFGRILHHNIDKGLLVAGEVETRFGGGIVNKPMLLVFGDRATYKVGDEEIDLNDLVIETAKDWIRRHLRFVDPDVHMRYQVELKRGSEALVDLFERGGSPGANDTSAAVGFAPLTRTEELVLKVEKYLNGKEFKRDFPETGEDVKVMGFRRGRELNLTVSMAFVDRFIESEAEYFRRKEEVLESLLEYVSENSDFENVNLYLNTADERGRGLGGVYLTVLGTSADGADCGQVGRGNRVNGIIPLYRPTSSEAAAGKNPINHVGKIYNALTYRMADEIYKSVTGIREAYVWLLSQIGRPIDSPQIASAELILEPGVKLSSVKEAVMDVIDRELENIGDFCLKLMRGEIEIC